MSSFSQEIKEELTGQIGRARHCQLAELAAILSSCGVTSVGRGGRIRLAVQSENIFAVRKGTALLQCAFGLTPEAAVSGSGRRHLYTLMIPDPERAADVLRAVKYLTGGGVLREFSLPVSGLLLQRSCCRRAFLRGCFLTAGSVSDPRKSYHFEIVCPNRERAEQVCEAIGSFDIEAKIIARKNSLVVYVKESDGISDILNVMGAPQSLMKLENIRILRDITGRVNRSVNCETANLNRTVSASVEQIRDIETIQRTMGLEALPPSLQEMAQVRLEHPDLPLKELGEYLTPPVGKSGVNHRLRRLREIAREL